MMYYDYIDNTSKKQNNILIGFLKCKINIKWSKTNQTVESQ